MPLPQSDDPTLLTPSDGEATQDAKARRRFRRRYLLPIFIVSAAAAGGLELWFWDRPEALWAGALALAFGVVAAGSGAWLFFTAVRRVVERPRQHTGPNPEHQALLAEAAARSDAFVPLGLQPGALPDDWIELSFGKFDAPRRPARRAGPAATPASDAADESRADSSQSDPAPAQPPPDTSAAPPTTPPRPAPQVQTDAQRIDEFLANQRRDVPSTHKRD